MGFWFGKSRGALWHSGLFFVYIPVFERNCRKTLHSWSIIGILVNILGCRDAG